MATTQMRSNTRADFRAFAEPYRNDGVTFLKGCLDGTAVRLVQAAYDWKLANPGPQAARYYPDSGATFLQASGDSIDQPDFDRMLKDTPIAGIVADLFGSGAVWYIGEQLFLKEGGGPTAIARRTPWHQDSSYLPFEGEKIAVVWIPLDPVPKAAALEIVRGSHKETTYNGSLFHPKDDTVPLYKGDPLPRLPDIEAQRDQWDDRIVSWPSAPGDVLIFHTASLHGGGATLPGMRRRSLTLRFVGDDVVRVARPQRRRDPGAAGDQERADRFERLPLGAPLWRSGIRKVHP
jgi:hypothetical protein